MTAARNGEKRLATVGDLLLELIDPSGGHHRSVKSQLMLSIHYSISPKAVAIRIQAAGNGRRFGRAALELNHQLDLPIPFPASVLLAVRCRTSERSVLRSLTS